MTEQKILHIGFDDTDSRKGMCTTFLAYKIVSELKKEKSEFLDYPRLIRFNPNIPWKTRGNGAVSISIKTKNVLKIKSKIKNLVKKYSDTRNGANPGLIFYENKKIPSNFTEFSELALWKLIQRNKAKKFVKTNNLDFFYQGNGQGLVGAIGAIGYKFNDHTLELLSYRKKSKFGTRRKISTNSVKQMQRLTAPHTFSSYDETNDHVMITPHGPDPVFYGIRGEKINSLLCATSLLRHDEKLAGHLVFKSNQGTGDHLKNELNLKNLKPYTSGKITGTISKKPLIIKGGHVIFQIKTSNFLLDCAVYKPTGITYVAKNLIEGDKVNLGGGIRRASKNHSRILNVEFIKILNLKKDLKKTTPFCTSCKKKMKSKGARQGFECEKCGKKQSKKISIKSKRKIQKKTYLPVISANRHLSRPLQRLEKMNKKSNFQKQSSWFSVYRN